MRKFISKSYFPFLVLIIATFLLYGNTLNNKYALDDSIVITDNVFVKKGFEGIKDILTNDTFTGFFRTKKDLVEGGRYRPFSLVTFAIEQELLGMNPFISHLINLLFYALSAILFYLVLQRLFSKQKNPIYLKVAFLSVFLWTIHPIHTEVVANIKGRDEILALFFSLLTWLFSLYFLEKNKIRYLVYSFLLFFLALLSKEISVSFLFIIPLSIYFFISKKISEIGKVALSLVLPFLAFLMVRYSVLHPFQSGLNMPNELMNNPFLGMTLAEKYATIIYTFGLYLKLLLIPYPLTYDYYPYHIPVQSFFSPIVLLSLLVHLLLIYIVFKNWKKNAKWSFVILFYALSFALVSNILFPIGTFMNERFMYISSWAYTFTLAWLFYYLVEKYKKWKTPIYIVSGVIVLVFSFIVINRNAVWYNNYTLFTTDVEVSKNSAKSNTSAAGVIIEELISLDKIKARQLKAVKQKIQETNLSQDEKEALCCATSFKTIKKNISLYKEKQLSKAISYLQKALEIHPIYTDALLLLGNAYYMEKKYDKVWEAYERILKQNPTNVLVRENWLKVLNSEMPPLQKIKYHQFLLTYNHNVAESHYQIGRIYGKELGNLDSCIVYLERARRISPAKKEVLKDLGVAYGMQKKYYQSIELMKEALKYAPRDRQLFINIGISYQQLGNQSLAKSYFDKAKALSK